MSGVLILAWPVVIKMDVNQRCQHRKHTSSSNFSDTGEIEWSSKSRGRNWMERNDWSSKRWEVQVNRWLALKGTPHPPPQQVLNKSDSVKIPADSRATQTNTTWARLKRSKCFKPKKKKKKSHGLILMLAVSHRWHVNLREPHEWSLKQMTK